jgi:RNA polymerase sigma-70 factor, ECF subfamily
LSAVEVSPDPRSRVDVLYRMYRHDVYRSLLRDLGSPADADDCTQTVFLSAMRALDRGCRPHAARAWLLAIAKNVARKAWRDRRIAVELEPDALAADESPGESRRELFAVLETLPSGQRTALVLHELYGLEYAEISELTDQTVAGVETSVFRGRKAVRTAMQNGGAVGHDDASRLLRRLVDGKLTRNEREAVAAHVRGCEECATVEAGLRSGKRRRGVFLWLLSAPSAAQRLLGFLQASPARGLGAVGVCVLGLAAMPSDRPADAGIRAAAAPVFPAAAAPSTAVAARQPVLVPQTPAAKPQRPSTSTSVRVVTPAGHPAPVAGSRRSSAPRVRHAQPERPPAAGPGQRPSGRAEARDASTPPRVTTESVRRAVPALPEPIRATSPVDVDGTVGNVVDLVDEAASGDPTGTGAAADATVGGALEDTGLPAPPPIVEPLTATVEGLSGAAPTSA